MPLILRASDSCFYVVHFTDHNLFSSCQQRKRVVEQGTLYRLAESLDLSLRIFF